MTTQLPPYETQYRLLILDTNRKNWMELETSSTLEGLHEYIIENPKDLEGETFKIEKVYLG